MDNSEIIACKVLDIMRELLAQLLEARENGTIPNAKLKTETKKIYSWIFDFFEKISDITKKEKYGEEINSILKVISIYWDETENLDW